MKRLIHKAGAWLACLLLLTALLPATASARGSVDVSRTDCTLSIAYPCAGISFRLYRVADISALGTFTLSNGFEKYDVSLADLDSAGWKDLSETLDGYIKRDQLTPVDTQTTDSSGKLTFTAKTPGLYLVTWDQHTTDGYTYKPQPFLVSLPGLDQNDGWVYTVNAVPKFDKEKVPDNPDGPDDPDTVTRRVLKVWKDNGNAAGRRPTSVTVQLLKNGAVYEEVTLNSDNNWKYEWTGLSAGDAWQVVEKDVPDGYTVSVGREGITFTVTNTLTPLPPTPPDTPDDPDDPDVLDDPDTPDTPDDPDTPDTPDKPDTPHLPDDPDTPNTPDVPSDGPDEPDIPQTGQLWWPVSLLACGGMGLFLAGWLKRRNNDRGRTDE